VAKQVPASSHPPESKRPVFNYDENAVPRFSGSLRGPIQEYDLARHGDAETEPLGYIPEVEQTFSYFEAASGICNEKGVMIAECTCSAIFGAEPQRGSKPLLGYMDLTRLALERCSTARDAVDLMGRLAEEYGFYGVCVCVCVCVCVMCDTKDENTTLTIPSTMYNLQYTTKNT